MVRNEMKQSGRVFYLHRTKRQGGQPISLRAKYTVFNQLLVYSSFMKMQNRICRKVELLK